MNTWKWISFGVVGSLFAVSHIGMIGYIATREKSKIPNINVPVGPYTSYVVQADEEGYKLSYTANDPKTAYITKDIKKKQCLGRNPNQRKNLMSVSTGSGYLLA